MSTKSVLIMGIMVISIIISIGVINKIKEETKGYKNYGIGEIMEIIDIRSKGEEVSILKSVKISGGYAKEKDETGKYYGKELEDWDYVNAKELKGKNKVKWYKIKGVDRVEVKKVKGGRKEYNLGGKVVYIKAGNIGKKEGIYIVKSVKGEKKILMTKKEDYKEYERVYGGYVGE